MRGLDPLAIKKPYALSDDAQVDSGPSNGRNVPYTLHCLSCTGCRNKKLNKIEKRRGDACLQAFSLLFTIWSTTMKKAGFRFVWSIFMLLIFWGCFTYWSLPVFFKWVQLFRYVLGGIFCFTPFSEGARYSEATGSQVWFKFSFFGDYL
jgi:hypothetical protein